MTTSETKREIRAMMRSKRRDLSSTDRERASFDLMKRLLALPGILHARRVAAYVANDGEIDPLPALTELVMTGVHGYLPVLFNTRRPRVRFARYFPNAPLAKGRFDIPIPLHDQKNLLDPVQLDWLLMPLVAFDANGSRLGMGGGFYDASLASRRAKKNWLRPRLIGIAHEFQRVDGLSVDSWDIPLDGILTDQAFRLIADTSQPPAHS
ncbi:5-formyltetrahydrofolate cyclo-ligase [Gammaproteobacteria bacterium]|nr:5-formyltetrahydrofolate cyclo-ligase [Gammaproteobacteria bacterium]